MVAPVGQQQQKPVPGVVVPQIQQQTQPAQVPAQQANMANQPAANAGPQQNNIIQTPQSANDAINQQQNQSTQQTVQSNQVSTQSNTQLEQPETPPWKKYLKYAGLVGGGLALGGGLYALGKYGFHPGASMPFFGDDETETVANDQPDENNAKPPTTSHRRVNYNGAISHLTTQAPMVGPQSSPTDNSWRFNPHRPQPGGMVKVMTPGMRQGYVGRGGNTGLWGIFGSGSSRGSWSFSGNSHTPLNVDGSSRGVYIGSSQRSFDETPNWSIYQYDRT